MSLYFHFHFSLEERTEVWNPSSRYFIYWSVEWFCVLFIDERSVFTLPKSLTLLEKIYFRCVEDFLHNEFKHSQTIEYTKLMMTHPHARDS